MREDIKEIIGFIQKNMVPKGFKKTDYGIINEEFIEVTISEEGRFRNGINFTRGEGKNIVKCLGVGDFGNNVVLENADKLEQICVIENDEQLQTYFLQDDDIVFVRSNGSKELVGRSILVKNLTEKVVHSGFCIRYRINSDYKITSASYINAWLENGVLKRLLHGENRGTNINNLNQEILGKLKICVPKIEEQKKILEIVNNYNIYISKMEELIELKWEKKKCLTRILLTGNKRFIKFNSGWKKAKLSVVLTERKEFSTKGTVYEHVSLTKEGIIPKGERYDREHLVKNTEKEYKITRLNDMCYNPANLKFGVICRNTYGDAIFSPIYVTFEVNSMYNIEFISQFITRWDFINAVRKYEEGTVYERMAVKPEDFLKFEVTLPELEEQSAIARVLSTADKEIELLEKKLELIKQEKKAMMQLLLTGIVRVGEEKMEVD